MFILYEYNQYNFSFPSQQSKMIIVIITDITMRSPFFAQSSHSRIIDYKSEGYYAELIDIIDIVRNRPMKSVSYYTYLYIWAVHPDPISSGDVMTIIVPQPTISNDPSPYYLSYPIFQPMTIIYHTKDNGYNLYTIGYKMYTISFPNNVTISFNYINSGAGATLKFWLLPQFTTFLS